MFTGIIEHVGTIEALDLKSGRGRITIHAPSLAPSLAIPKRRRERLLPHGRGSWKETILRRPIRRNHPENLVRCEKRRVKKGSRVNLEQPLTAGKEFGGHFVQGHVDGTGRVTRLVPESLGNSSWLFSVEVPEQFARYVVSKGSITIDGISLTVGRWNSPTRAHPW